MEGFKCLSIRALYTNSTETNAVRMHIGNVAVMVRYLEVDDRQRFAWNAPRNPNRQQSGRKSSHYRQN